ncbi:hypothetical protein JCM5353_004145, partial [Sporobolomyces roseus]
YNTHVEGKRTGLLVKEHSVEGAVARRRLEVTSAVARFQAMDELSDRLSTLQIESASNLLPLVKSVMAREITPDEPSQVQLPPLKRLAGLVNSLHIISTRLPFSDVEVIDHRVLSLQFLPIAQVIVGVLDCQEYIEGSESFSGSFEGSSGKIFFAAERVLVDLLGPSQSVSQVNMEEFGRFLELLNQVCRTAHKQLEALQQSNPLPSSVAQSSDAEMISTSAANDPGLAAQDKRQEEQSGTSISSTQGASSSSLTPHSAVISSSLTPHSAVISSSLTPHSAVISSSLTPHSAPIEAPAPPTITSHEPQSALSSVDVGSEGHTPFFELPATGRHEQHTVTTGQEDSSFIDLTGDSDSDTEITPPASEELITENLADLREQLQNLRKDLNSFSLYSSFRAPFAKKITKLKARIQQIEEANETKKRRKGEEGGGPLKKKKTETIVLSDSE